MSVFAFRVFASVMENASFVRAAKAIHITPSAVSHSIAKLEEDFQLKLFTRNRLGVQPTADGEKLYPFILSVLHGYERLSQEVSKIKGLTTGTVRVGVFHSVCLNWVPEIVGSFRKTYPGVEISISQGNYDDVTNWLLSGYTDLGFITLTCNTAGFDYTPLFKDRMVCITSRDYRPQMSPS